MARILITGAADGLGQRAAQALVKQGHKVVLHARSQKRCEEAMASTPGAETCLAADLSSMAETKQLAEEINKLGKFDAIIHNAGMGTREANRDNTTDELPSIFAVNSLAPYILTCLVEKPKRLIYISSGLHTSGNSSLSDLTWKSKKWDAFQAYSDTKLHNVLLAKAVAKRFPDVISTSVDPGWVQTKMGGVNAPGDVKVGTETQVYLVTSEDEQALKTGQHWYRMSPTKATAVCDDEEVQKNYLKECEKISGVSLNRAGS